MNYQILDGLEDNYISELAGRLYSRIQANGECWEWQGALNSKGYGCIAIHKVSQLAHRVSYELTYGAIPDNFQVCHHCDNPRCIRPAHLFTGTASDNMQDMARKGRHGRQKISRQHVVFWRNNFNPKIHSIPRIAEGLGVRPETLRAALAGHTYKTVGGKRHSVLHLPKISKDIYPQVFILKEQGLSILKIADKLSIGKSSVSRILNGTQRKSG